MATRRQSSAAAAEPVVPMVTVTWLRSTDDAAGEHACNIGDRHYPGRRGEQVEIREDDAVILAAGGFVKRVAAEA